MSLQGAPWMLLLHGFFSSGSSPLVLLRGARCSHSWIKCVKCVIGSSHKAHLYTLGITLKVLVVHYLEQYPSLIYQSTREENAHGGALCLGGDRPLFQWPIILKPQSSEKCPIELKAICPTGTLSWEQKPLCSEGQNKLHFPFWNICVSMILVHLCQIKTFLYQNPLFSSLC